MTRQGKRPQGGIGNPLTARKGIEGRESRSAGYNVRCQKLNPKGNPGLVSSGVV